MVAASLKKITIIGIETIQYVFYIGTFDIWDIFTNFTGCMIGYIFCKRIINRMV
ncbi:VanZ family protein [Escherichia coli]|uniref:VanZ family protein n=1 Tax=Escherichia coli TaxID=562 RepID=UPI001BDB6FB1